MATVTELRQQRRAIWERMKEINDLAEREGRDLTGEENGNWERANADIAALDGRISRQETLERSVASDDGRRDMPVGRQATAAYDPEARTNLLASTEYRSAYNKFLRFGMPGLNGDEQRMMATASAGLSPEMRAMGITTAAAGGVFVPEDFNASLEAAMLFYGGMRQVATVVRTSYGGDLQYPTANDTGNTGELVSEHAALSLQDVSTGAEILKAHMFSSKIVKVSRQLLQDSAFDIEGYLSQALGERIGRAQNTQFTTGTGANAPKGIALGATTGVTGATGQATTVTWDDLIGLEHSVDIAYRNAAKYMLADTTLRDIRKIKDGDGRYIWTPAVANGAPSTINGYPYVVNNDVAVMAANAISIYFGDMRKYIIRDVVGVTLVRLDELYAANLQVGFLAFARADGSLVDAGTNPVKTYVNSAS